MGCTTILVGKKASADGSTIMARTDDSGHGSFEAKRFEVIAPEDLPKTYRSVLSHVEIPLPETGLRYTRFPDVDTHKGLWAGAGINSARVSMTATETLTSNERVLGADPLVELREAQGEEGQDGFVPEQPGGIGEEDMVVLVLPYIKTAREGVLRLGELLQQYGTYEMNGIGFADNDDVWWLETVGGHHWLARRLPEECYAVIANQFSLDDFDFDDALGEGRDYLCSPDLREFVADNHLDTAQTDGQPAQRFNPRLAFGSRSDSDHTYNTPRVWALQRFLNPTDVSRFGFHGDSRPDSDELDWCLIPERLITMEDVKYTQSYHYQGTPFNPYARAEQARIGGADQRGMYRPIGINRTNFVAALQIRPEKPATTTGLNWIAYGAMPFNALVPFYANVRHTPEYLEATTQRVTTEHHYWANRIIAALVDAHYHQTIPHVERYQQKVVAAALQIVARTDRAVAELGEDAANNIEDSRVYELLEAANAEIADLLKRETDDLLDKVLFDASLNMHNSFSRDDA